MQTESEERAEARLNLLRSSGILQSRPESAYDDLVELAASLSGARFAALTFREDDSLWSKATTHPVFRELPAYSDAPCIHVLNTGEPLVVPNAAKDARFERCPVVTSAPRLQFYAGVPVVSWGGHVLGVLFVADSEPRAAFSSSDLQALRTCASLAAELIEFRARVGEVAGRQDREGRVHGSDVSTANDSDVKFGEDDSMSLGSAQRFEALTNLIPQIVWSTTPDGYHDYFNERWYAYTDMPRTGDQGWKWKDYLHPDDVDRTLEVWHHALATGEPYEVLYRFRRARDGAYRWFIGRAMPLFNSAGEIARWFGTCTDVHEERIAEEKLSRMAEFRQAVMSLVEDSLTARHPEEFFQRVLDRAVDVIPGAQAGAVLFRAADGMFDFVAGVGYDLDALKQVRFTHDRASMGDISRLQPKEITDYSEGEPLPPRDRRILETAGRATEIAVSLNIPVVLDGEATAFMSLDNFEARDAFGDEAAEMARIFAGYVGTLAQRFRLEQQLHRLAYVDVLTELPNRAALEERIRKMVEEADERGRGAAILFIDLDGFKEVNDALGHRAGDQVLHVVGRRLLRCVRSEEVVGRLGGDEFAVIVEGEDVASHARIVARRILKAVSDPIATSDGVVSVTASIGIAVYPSDGESTESMLSHADIAMYRAKRAGKNTFDFFRGESQGGAAD